MILSPLPCFLLLGVWRGWGVNAVELELSGATEMLAGGRTVISESGKVLEVECHSPLRNREATWVNRDTKAKFKSHILRLWANPAISGVYVCYSTFIGGETLTATIQVYVSSPEVIVNQDEILLEPGTNLTLECETSDGFFPTNWLHNGRKLDFNNTRYLMDEHALIISYVSAADTGYYLCEFDERKTQPTYGFIILNSKPFLDQPQEVNLCVSNDTVLWLDCLPQGHPTPIMSWSRNGEWIKARRGQYHFSPSYNDIEDTRLVVPAEKSSTFACRAENKLGFSQAYFNVWVNCVPDGVKCDMTSGMGKIAYSILTLLSFNFLIFFDVPTFGVFHK